MKKQFWLCAYGQTIRTSIKVATAAEAARYCYGVTDRVTCLAAGGRKDVLQNRKKLHELQQQLVLKHQELTGNVIKLADF